MEELLKRLEKQIKTLIDQHDQLKQSNQRLHQGKYSLIREREQLLVKQQRAISQINTLVTKLKEIGKLP